MSLLPIFVKLSSNQKQKLIRGYKKENVNLKIKESNEKNGSRIYVTKTQYDKIMKGIKPVIITFNETHYKPLDKDTQEGGNLLSSLLPALTKIGSKVLPIITKTVLPGLATGVASALGSLGIDQIFGNGAKFNNSKTGDIIKALAVIQNELSKLPKKTKINLTKL